eukprot:Nitzschia sp. Nitz4//scaffold138_size62050//48900//50324//NITZ4_006396-RA/size62050-processed-gene-0.23-mRNA-1//-1//CDS//3329535791//8557//frame0
MKSFPRFFDRKRSRQLTGHQNWFVVVSIFVFAEISQHYGFTTAQSISCTLCPFGEAVGAPAREIPQLGSILGGAELSPTCEVAAAYAEITSSEEICTMLQAQAAYCECPSVSKPAPGNACTLCATAADQYTSGQATPTGITCKELSEVMSYMTTYQCESTEYGQILKRNAALCGCTNTNSTSSGGTVIDDEQPTAAVEACLMCADGSIDSLQYPERVVPFFSLAGNANPTCYEISFAAAIADPTKIHCDAVTAQAGYCGCPTTTGTLPEPIDECSFCPDGTAPANMDYIVPSTSDVCSDLYTYVRHMDATSCQSKRLESIQALGYVCGCATVTEPSCTLCANGEPPTNPAKVADPATEISCEEAANRIASYSAEVCLDMEVEIAVQASRCCPEAPTMPVCSIRQNQHLCTNELLDSAAAGIDCECYSFCDGVFKECQDFPGALLTFPRCLGTPISGCNRSGARDSDERRKSYLR